MDRHLFDSKGTNDNRCVSLVGPFLFPLITITLFLILFWIYRPSPAESGGNFVVNSAADTDDGACNAANCTLREAIQAANSAGVPATIVFSLPSNSTITLAGTQLPPISGRVTIDGSTAVNLTISGNDASRVLVVGPDPLPYPGLNDGGSGPGEIGGGTAVTLTNLTIIKGSEPFDRGAGIYNSETLVIQNITFSNNKSKQGGIFNEGSLTIADSSFINNKIVDYSGGGAALYNQQTGVVTITNSTFSLNEARLSFTAAGGIYNDGGDISITDSIFDDNVSFSASAIYHKSPGSLDIVDTTFTNQSFGPAVDAGGNTDILGSTFSDNIGGGLHVNGYATVNIEDTVFSNNSTPGFGGAIESERGSVRIKDSLFSGNSADSWGGAIKTTGTLIIETSTFTNNSSSSIGGAIMKAYGGGITVEATTFQGNTADEGGAIGIQSGSITIRNSTLSGNSAVTSGGGIHSGGSIYLYNSSINENGAGSGGGIYSYGDLSMSNSILANSLSGGDCVQYGDTISNINNLVEDGSCNATFSGDPLLSPLESNGGPTLTHNPLPGSLAIDNGDNDECLPKDQRGVPRPIDGDDDGQDDCDIGAVEKGRFVEVNSANDLNSGVCNVSHCSLREAIIRANTNSGLDIILFNIPGPGPHTIQLSSPLPTITGPILIFGFSQPGAKPNTMSGNPGYNAVMQIELDGANAGPLATGLTLRSYNSLIQGLVIHSFGGDGIRIDGSGATGNRLVGNFIGTNVTGNGGPGNGGANIFIGSGASNNVIGGEGADEGNIIAFAGGNGIVILSNTAIGNEIRSNAIYSNGLLGVDLGNDGPTANDPGDGDGGPNTLQNFPSLASITANLGETQLIGSLSSTASTTFTLEFFTSSTCDSSGFGEGENLLGTAVLSIDNTGSNNFDITFPTEVPTNDYVSATATDPDGNSSEFAPCVGVINAPISGLTATNSSPSWIYYGVSLYANVDSGGNVDYLWNFGDGTYGAGAFTFHRYPAEGLYTAVVTASNSVNMLTATTVVSITEEVPTSVSITDFGPAMPESGRAVWPVAAAVIGFVGWLVVYGRRRQKR